MKIAVIGSGIAGMTAANYLSVDHTVYLYETANRLGGHTATVAVEDGAQQLAIDTGFIVFNDKTYPGFLGLLDALGVQSQPTVMSFSVSDALSGLEYAGTSLNTLFAQRRNLWSPRFLRLVRDIIRFNRQVEADLHQQPALADAPLGDYLRLSGYGKEFHDYYLLPMGAAIWSSSQQQIAQFPLQFVVNFFRNHGLLSLRNRPQWRVIKGGSNHYIAPLTHSFRDNIRLNTPVYAIARCQYHHGIEQVCVTSAQGDDYFDQVVLACHSDQALRLLADASAAEHSILAAIPYTRNEVVLHTDTRLLPRNPRTWSSWNVSVGRSSAALPALTYNMNILQGLVSSKTWCVSLNQSELIRQEHIHSSYHYEHPLFSLAGVAAQQRWSEINGVNRTWFCGAWWRYGFHEDGVWSAGRVATGIQQQVAQGKHADSQAVVV
jgi:uncharacterized protein